jgi:hypothetical protein
MKNQQITSPAAGAVTAQYDFWPATNKGENLFSVRAGIPLSDAFDQLSYLMSSSIASVETLACEKDTDTIPGALWQSVHLMNFAYALVQSIHGGHNADRREPHAVDLTSVDGGKA